MNPGPHIVQFPFAVLPAAILALVLIGVLCYRALRANPTQRSDNGDREPDWSTPAIDTFAGRDSPFHRWDPRIKIAAALVYIFCVASLDSLAAAAAALLLSLLAIRLARLPFSFCIRRVAAMSAFLGMFILVLPATVPLRDGDLLVRFTHLEFLPFNLRGLYLALTICVKACAIALLMDPVFGTATLSVNMHALVHLRVPPRVCEMILLCHRYIHVFQDEMQRMAVGMQVRGFRGRTDLETLRTLGNFLGMLLVRSFERTQRVHQAMLARGYRGVLPGSASFRAGRADWSKGTLGLLLALSLLTLDWLA